MWCLRKDRNVRYRGKIRDQRKQMDVNMPDDRPLSTGDVARLLHVTPVCVLRWIRAGKLSAYRVPGGHFRVARFAFRRFLADNRIPLTFESLPARRVLVAADEHSVQTVFGAAPKAKGYDVVLTGTGQDLQIGGEYYQAGLISPPADNWRREDCICLTNKQTVC